MAGDPSVKGEEANTSDPTCCFALERVRGKWNSDFLSLIFVFSCFETGFDALASTN